MGMKTSRIVTNQNTRRIERIRLAGIDARECDDDFGAYLRACEVGDELKKRSGATCKRGDRINGHASSGIHYRGAQIAPSWLII